VFTGLINILSQKEIDKYLRFPNQTRFNDVYLHISQIEKAPQLAQISIAYEFLPKQEYSHHFLAIARAAITIVFKFNLDLRFWVK
jgi:hypothetical protein